MNLTPEEIEEMDKKYAGFETKTGKIKLQKKPKIDKFAGFRENETVSAEYAETFNVGW
jgi:hypothetical protein